MDNFFPQDTRNGAVSDNPKTARQKSYVKETLYRALDEVERAKRGETKLQTLDEFIEELEREGYL